MQAIDAIDFALDFASISCGHSFLLVKSDWMLLLLIRLLHTLHATYIKVKEEWCCPYRTIYKIGYTFDIKLRKKTRSSSGICVYEKISGNLGRTNGFHSRQSSGITLFIQKIKGIRHL